MTATRGPAGSPEGGRPPAVDACTCAARRQLAAESYPDGITPELLDRLAPPCPHHRDAAGGHPAPAELPEPPQQWVRLVHWITGLSMDLGCDAANVPGARASSVIGEVSCAACHAAYRDAATVAAELRRLFGGVL